MHLASHPIIGSSRRLRWLLALPTLGMALLLVTLLALLWLLHRNEIDEERTALIKDVLWLEQNLRFHLNGNEEQLQQLALEMANLPGQRKVFRLRAEHMLKNSPDIARILWLDDQRKVVDALPTSPSAEFEPGITAPSVSGEAFELASRLGQRQYSAPYVSANKRGFVELHCKALPAARSGRPMCWTPSIAPSACRRCAGFRTSA